MISAELAAGQQLRVVPGEDVDAVPSAGGSPQSVDLLSVPVSHTDLRWVAWIPTAPLCGLKMPELTSAECLDRMLIAAGDGTGVDIFAGEQRAIVASGQFCANHFLERG